MKDKRGIERDILVEAIIIMIVIAIIFATYLVISGKGSSLIAYAKSLFGFGGSGI